MKNTRCHEKRCCRKLETQGLWSHCSFVTPHPCTHPTPTQTPHPCTHPTPIQTPPSMHTSHIHTDIPYPYRYPTPIQTSPSIQTFHIHTHIPIHTDIPPVFGQGCRLRDAGAIADGQRQAQDTPTNPSAHGPSKINLSRVHGARAWRPSGADDTTHEPQPCLTPPPPLPAASPDARRCRRTPFGSRFLPWLS